MGRFSLSRPARFFRRQTSQTSASQSSTGTSNTTTATAATSADIESGAPSPSLQLYAPVPRKSSSLAKLRENFEKAGAEVPEPVQEQRESVLSFEEVQQAHQLQSLEVKDGLASRRSGSETLALAKIGVGDLDSKTPSVDGEELTLDIEELVQPVVTVQHPTPDARTELSKTETIHRPLVDDCTSVPGAQEQEGKEVVAVALAGRPDSSPSLSPHSRPVDTSVRRQSIVNSANAKIVKTLIDAPARLDGLPTSSSTTLPPAAVDYFPSTLPNMASVMHRKIWVRRPGASATLVQIREDDLVDDVRDMILKKYANSLGRTFDAPDMTLRIASPAEHHGASRSERVLGPEEEMCRTIDTYYPGGQTVDDALIIDVPQKRTPRPSPRAFHHPSYHAMDEYRPLENGTDYFPPMPALVPPTIPQTAASHESGRSHLHGSVAAGADHHQRSISVLNTGQIPPLPSPGGTRRHRVEREHRPRVTRQHTSSPTVLSHPPANVAAGSAGVVAVQPPNLNPAHMVHRSSARPRVDSSASETLYGPNGVPAAPPLPTPPAPEAAPTNKNNSTPPTPSGGPITNAHLYRNSRSRRVRRSTPDKPNAKSRHQQNDSISSAALPALSGVLDGSVPPINVLIVEDNSINLRILEGLMRRLKVRWQTAMNGQIAVDKWRSGGFHLVLMDIQMPVMNGLAATNEIRRLERVNGIGVFSSSTPTSPMDPKTNGDSIPDCEEAEKHVKDPAADKIVVTEGLFKSPVIIVALTASSLQSDRHEALAAGCNDFLTKPVNFVWLERKVKEWGCMQALIDFDGWRKWKDYAAKEEAGKGEDERKAGAEKDEKQRVKIEKMAKLQEKRLKKEEDDRRKKRQSLELGYVAGPSKVTKGSESAEASAASGGDAIGTNATAGEP